jgi:polar amino acid transport system ATP-binding protein
MPESAPAGTPLGRDEEPLVRAVNVTKRFGSSPVLQGVDFTLGASEVACLVGPSGSGKTTFLRCLNQLETINGGRIWINGELIGLRENGSSLMRLPERAIVRQRASIGMVFQHFNLFRHLSVLDNLIEAPVHVLKMDKREAIEIAMQMLERVGLADKHSKYPGQLSGGQQQRVAIAWALTMRPQLMLFDEPTSALDPELVGEVLTVMRQLAADGMSMIVVTHEIAFGREVGDKAVFMDAGKVVAQGTPGEVFDNPEHERLQRFLARVGG